MKNIHVLSTEKPSRLCFDRNDNLLFAPNEGFTIADEKQHIYITSPNEDINENDYIITKDGRLVEVSYLLSKDLEGASKVVLTTDQDLIKNGVQPIDDEFLEWFVNNTSCDEVEVVNNLKYFNVDELRERHLKGLSHLYSEKIGYKIIIPKEELKQEQEVCNHCGKTLREQMKGCGEIICYRQFLTKQEFEYIGECKGNDGNGCFMDSPGHDCGCFIRKPKQETLEEAVKKYLENNKYFSPLNCAKIGAKWQSERMYSEEEVLRIITSCKEYLSFGDEFNEKEFFEQFKKK